MILLPIPSGGEAVREQLRGSLLPTEAKLEHLFCKNED